MSLTRPVIASEIAQKYLRLHLCKDIGPIRFANLLRELGDIDRVLGASVRQLSGVERIGGNLAEHLARRRDDVDVAKELDLAAKEGVRILCAADPDYPALLRMMNDSPPCIYIRGTLHAEDAVSLAIVGSRHCSRYGSEQSERFAALGAKVGLTIVSGMARGIDTCAHRGALAGGGRTIAVLGCGLCHLYPPESSELAIQIQENGCLLTELPMSVPPDAKNFPQRNRIIAGLTLGVLVIEAAKQSGALISARHANEYNREVFALPGRIDMPSAEGCNSLIRQGAAKLVMKIEDILEELGDAGRALMSDNTSSAQAKGEDSTLFDQPKDTSASFGKLSEIETAILKAIAGDSASADELCDRTGLPAAKIAAMLPTLQIKGLVRRLHGDRYERAR